MQVKPYMIESISNGKVGFEAGMPCAGCRQNPVISNLLRIEDYCKETESYFANWTLKGKRTTKKKSTN